VAADARPDDHWTREDAALEPTPHHIYETSAPRRGHPWLPWHPGTPVGPIRRPAPVPCGGSRTRAKEAKHAHVPLRPAEQPLSSEDFSLRTPGRRHGLGWSFSTTGSVAGSLRTVAHGFAGEVAAPARRGSPDRQPASPDKPADGARSGGIASFHGHTRCTAGLAHGVYSQAVFPPAGGIRARPLAPRGGIRGERAHDSLEADPAPHSTRHSYRRIRPVGCFAQSYIISAGTVRRRLAVPSSVIARMRRCRAPTAEAAQKVETVAVGPDVERTHNASRATAPNQFLLQYRHPPIPTGSSDM